MKNKTTKFELPFISNGILPLIILLISFGNVTFSKSKSDVSDGKVESSISHLELVYESYYEAENGVLFGEASISSCDPCSGGSKVGNMGFSNYFTIDVDVAEAGIYNMNFGFTSGDPRSVFISANGNASTEVLCESSDWDIPGENEVEITLASGVNTIRFFNNSDYAPDIDGFSLSFLREGGDDNLVYEAEDGTLFDGATIADCETCSGGRKVGDLGGDNRSYFTYDVNMASGGVYNLNFTFISGDERSIFISANEGAGTEVVCKSADWDTTGENEIEITLVAGINTIRFFNDVGFAPDIDKFSLELVSTNIPICPDCEELTYGNGGTLVYDTSTGTLKVYDKGTLVINDAYSEAMVGDQQFTSKNYSQITIIKEDFSDAIGSGTKMEVSLTSNELPSMTQVFYTYSGKDYFLSDLFLNGENLGSNYMAPLVSEDVSIDAAGDNRVLKVPFDNDTFIRYESNPVADDSRNVSSEVTSFYENTSRKGLVAGSVEQTVWKTGVETQGSGSSLNLFKIWGGYTSESVTRDIIEHGKINGNSLKSPKVFIGFYDDWRLGMEEYGRASKLANEKYIADWDKPTPFGWNSWGSIQADLNLDKAKAVVDFFAEEIPMFRNDDIAYIDLDSYWDNMVEGGLEGDFSQLHEFVEYCLEHDLKPGIYWAPFVDFGKFDRKVEGSTYNYIDVWTDLDGSYHDLDDCRALDPTHPATKDRIDLVIGKFKDAGFEMIKIDFIGHASVEASSYFDPNITTGMQAFRVGMEYLLDRIGDDMLVYAAISPNLATGRYAHMRRIATDAFADINATEYTLNSTTYGWWQTEVYDFIDADHVVFGNASIGENRARLISAVVNGTIITGDDFSTPGPWDAAAKSLLQNQNILGVAKNGKAFTPVEGDSNTGSELFHKEVDGKNYLAIFNYGNEKSYTIDLNRLGMDANGYCVKELFTGDRFSLDNNNLTISLAGRDAAFYEFNDGANSCVFSLPNNYSILSRDVSCTGNTDGSIAIEFANLDYTYSMQLEGGESMSIPANTSNYTLDSLAAGIYSFCFKIDGISDYEQCFEIIIEEPGQVAATSDFSEETGILSLDLKGADRFYVNINGTEQERRSGVHEFQLQTGLNVVSVTGDLECQGTYLNSIYMGSELKIYPNPTSGLLKAIVPGQCNEVSVYISNMQGVIVQSLQLNTASSKLIDIDISSLAAGMYLLKLSNEDINESVKLIKK